MTPHQFIEADRVTRPNPEASTASIFRHTEGLKVMCAICGEVRHLWPTDGTVETIINGNPDNHNE